jgi:hypothetical protein
MTRVVKVMWAAAKNRWRAGRRRRKARARTGFSGPVNLPPGALLDGSPGIGAAMARVHSYEWLQSAAEGSDEEGAHLRQCAAGMSARAFERGRHLCGSL